MWKFYDSVKRIVFFRLFIAGGKTKVRAKTRFFGLR